MNLPHSKPAFCHPPMLKPLLAALLLAWSAAPALAATFTVNHNGDAPDASPGDGVCATGGGVCTLRAAIQEANALAGIDTIEFNIGGGGPVTIAPTSTLPSITGTTFINGYSQPGATPNNLTTGNNAVVLVRVDGTSAGGMSGLVFNTGSNGSSLRGLSVTGFGMAGVVVANATGVNLGGNFIGTDTTGANLGNGGTGVMLNGTSGVLVGTVNAADRNVIARNSGHGVQIANATGVNVVNNNYIGTTPNGLSVAPNLGYGVQVTNSHQAQMLSNVITGYLGGIQISGASNQNQIRGNRIGVGADGAAGIGNGNPGVPGILFIGEAANQAPNTATVGGINAGDANTISNWGGAGIRLERTYLSYGIPTNVQIRGNAIYGNGELGIDLVDPGAGTGAGVNANDSLDMDDGPNNYLNYPVVSSASTDGSHTTVSFSLSTYPSGGPFALDVYASPSCDASGHGEGRTWLGSRTYTTDSSGIVADTITGLPAAPAGHFITMTSSENVVGWFTSTSEFSACVAVTGAGGGGGSGGAQPVPTLGWLAQWLTALAVGAGALLARRRLQNK